MINRVTSSIVPKVATRVMTNNGAKKGDRLSNFLKSPVLGKVLDAAGENPVICQSAFALALCCVARPVTNYAVTKDKQDAGYASSHSIASGIMGFVWPLIFATPLAMGVKKIAKNPQKYLKAERIKQFYPKAKTIEEIGEDGKKALKIATNAEGKMLREDGTVLLQSLEPKMIYGEAERAAFESKNAGFYVDSSNVVRSKTVFKTEGGEFKLDKQGNKIGCAVQEYYTPITEEMKLNYQKDSSKFAKALEPEVIKDAEEAAKFTEKYGKEYYIDNEGVVRSKFVHETNNGQPVLDSEGKNIGAPVMQNLVPITEDMEIGVTKEENVKNFINMIPDIILAPPRAFLTIKLIPPILGALGIKKAPKGGVQLQDNNGNNTKLGYYKNINPKSPFVAFKKGGV